MRRSRAPSAMPHRDGDDRAETAAPSMRGTRAGGARRQPPAELFHASRHLPAAGVLVSFRHRPSRTIRRCRRCASRARALPPLSAEAVIYSAFVQPGRRAARSRWPGCRRRSRKSTGRRAPAAVPRRHLRRRSPTRRRRAASRRRSTPSWAGCAPATTDEDDGLYRPRPRPDPEQRARPGSTAARSASSRPASIPGCRTRCRPASS